MTKLTQRPVLLAGLICAALLVAVMVWIAVSESGMPQGVYHP
ncbi:MAG: hypothetical protein SGI72_02075 [Planctomycetota bacterium]|nr:hypothetical protein [Planctomycetota bacterium]